MLSRLLIDNYALIDHTEVEFSNGFSVITGETGAGKSIMLDALSLLTGARADFGVIGDKSKKTIVEATFKGLSPLLQSIIENDGIEWDKEEFVVRREISPSGKSRAFVNDTPVTLSFLNEIAGFLLDIHSQHSNRILTDSHSQLEILDLFGGNQETLKDFKDVFHKYVALRGKIKKAKEAQKTNRENRDFILFRLEQLEKLKPKEGELQQLEKEFEILSDADRIKSDLTDAVIILDGNSNSAIRHVNEAASSIERVDLSLFHSGEDEDIISRLASIKIELKDISDTLAGYLDRVEVNPERLEKVKTRIDLINEAMRRFKVRDERELVGLHSQLKEELASIDGDSPVLKEWEKELKELGILLKTAADKLTEKRLKSAREFTETLTDITRPLGLPNVKINIEIEKGKISSEGQDEIRFLCSFNKNHPMQSISEIASGGEISRMMLGIKSLMASKINLPTIIFDEIDTGVSGEIAHKMGKMMLDMSQNMQVFSVTHLPQVAASGKYHYKVFKTDDAEKTVSQIKSLDAEERVKEIAGMLSGTKINEAALHNARMLLETV